MSTCKNSHKGFSEMRQWFLSILLWISPALFSTSCISMQKRTGVSGNKHSVNWKSTQANNRWTASFQRFNGSESLNFKSATGKIIYLDAWLYISPGNLSLSINHAPIAESNAIIHQKINLLRDVRIRLEGKEAGGSFQIAYPSYQIKKINIHFNVNAELLALSHLLTIYNELDSIPDTETIDIGSRKVKVRELYSLNLKVATEFIPFLKSKNLTILKAFFDKDFYLHYANFVLSLKDFPSAAVTKNNPFINKFQNQEDAEKFTEALNSFYREISFDKFLSRYKPYYDKISEEIKNNLPGEDFMTEMEHFYGTGVSNYNLYPSLAMLFSTGFAVGDKDMIGNLFGSFKLPEHIDRSADMDLGFDDPAALRSLCIHEFGHSFVNPAIDRTDGSILSKSESLFDPVRDKMSEQGYNQWKICLYEHFVRAGEVILAKLVGDPDRSVSTMNDYVSNRSFIYLPQIVNKLEYWYNHEFFQKTYQQKVAEIISELK